MNKRIIFAVLLLAAGLQTAWAQSVIINLKNGKKVFYSVEELDSIHFNTSNDVEEHEWVDLGLPSGTLWATMNVGAESPEGFGDYFAWGETKPKDTYSWGNYELCLGGYDTSLLKYICDEWHGDLGYMDNISELQPEDDAATANWGDKWQMPSFEQFSELYDDMNTTTVWTTVNGVNGRKITSKINGKSIFLPAAGLYTSSLENSGTNGYYWSNTLDYGLSCWAMSLHIYQSRNELMSESRYEGRSVRPVRVEKVEREEHDYVDLGLPSGTLWATCNIGANSPEERGDRFAWAETETKETYEMDNYKYGDYLQIEKYCTNSEYGTSDGNTMLDMMDDAAVVNWGAEWQMPSKSQFKELIDSQYTTTEPAVQNGVNGWRITSKANGNSIFLPSTSDDSSQNKGTYWSRNLYPFYCDMAYALIFDANNIKTFYNDRTYGEFVRPVKYKDPILVSKIELNHTQLVLENAAERLTATVLPANADNDYVVWTTSDEDVAYLQDDMWVNPVSPGTCTITCRSTDGSRVYAECHITVLECHDYVNLGLPSGTLWATCNVGASKPEEYGDYFAWGETEPKEDYSWSTYFDTEDDGDTFKKYNNDGGLTELLPEDDAATANWGSVWQMPSLDQIKELINSNYTTTTWTTQNGVNGRKITSKSNGNSIFLPAAGCHGASLYSVGSSGIYWSPSLSTNYSDDACGLSFNSSGSYTYGGSRSCGRSVRPVRKQ